jgi:crotonobetainyl-CoA:carnitine CoA-transferase CaiB-like acyl-CoA transferase
MDPASSSAGALRGLRVVEVGQLIAGPFCGHLFADHGAEVIKVEPPGDGDIMRKWGGNYKGLGLYWPILARQKKSVTLNLRVGPAQDLLRSLLATADVLVENFRPGTLEKWGLGWPDLHALNPRLIMVRVSGYERFSLLVGRARPGTGARRHLYRRCTGGDARVHRRNARAVPPRPAGWQRAGSDGRRRHLRIDVGVHGGDSAGV